MIDWIARMWQASPFGAVMATIGALSSLVTILFGIIPLGQWFLGVLRLRTDRKAFDRYLSVALPRLPAPPGAEPAPGQLTFTGQRLRQSAIARTTTVKLLEWLSEWGFLELQADIGGTLARILAARSEDDLRLLQYAVSDKKDKIHGNFDWDAAQKAMEALMKELRAKMR